MNQKCNKCNKVKDISDFEWQKNRPNPKKTCKSCRYMMRDRKKELKRHREYSKLRRKEKPDEVRRSWERSVYGFCKEDLNQKECQICGSINKLCIDHCHHTKNVRGLLCRNCNFGLGMFKDDIELLKSAIQYLNGPHFQLSRRKYK